jgi:hypothetical protein
MIAFIAVELAWALEQAAEFRHQFIGNGNEVVNVLALST